MLRMEPMDLLILFAIAVLALLTARISTRGMADRDGNRGEIDGGRDGWGDGRFKHCAFVVEPGFKCLREVLEEMPAIRNLLGLGRAPADGFGVAIGPIPADYCNGGILLQPGDHRVRLAIWQEGYGLLAFQVDHDGAEPPSAPAGPVVDADYTRGEIGRQG